MKKIFVALAIGSIALVIYSCGNGKQGSIEAASNSLQVAQSGAVLFDQNCSVCHAMQEGSFMSNAPELNKVKEHWNDIESLKKFIANAAEQKDMNEHTKQLFEAYKTKPQMTPFTGLSNAELDSLVGFLLSR